MKRHRDAHLAGRERRRLALARENGYLNATGAGKPVLLKAFGLWCWLLKIPMVWFERRTPRSRYGCVRLDLLTTANMLTANGQSEVTNLAAGWEGRVKARASPHDARWEHVPVGDMDRLAKAAYRAATRVENVERNRPKMMRIKGRRLGEVLEFGGARVALG